MLRARVVERSGVQFIELPTEISIDTRCVDITRDGEDIILRPARISAKEMFDCLVQMPKDFFAEEKDDSRPQERKSF